MVVERDVIPGEEDPAKRSDREFDWEIPERKTFDAIMGKAIDKFTEDDWDLLDYMSFSSVGWNTGVAMFAFGSNKTTQMQKFREILRTIEIEGKRFESYPKRMLLNPYAITIYFTAAFEHIKVPKLLFWFKKFNGFQGKVMVDTKHYPADHPTRKGCKIASCDADQQFLDELYRFPKDHAFHIRFGGNLYVRGGERIDPDDPVAVRKKRPRLSRQAARQFISGAGEDILNKGQKEDDEAAKAYRAKQARENVSESVLFTPTKSAQIAGETVKVLCLNFETSQAETRGKKHWVSPNSSRNSSLQGQQHYNVFNYDSKICVAIDIKDLCQAREEENRKYRWGRKSTCQVDLDAGRSVNKTIPMTISCYLIFKHQIKQPRPKMLLSGCLVIISSSSMLARLINSAYDVQKERESA